MAPRKQQNKGSWNSDATFSDVELWADEKQAFVEWRKKDKATLEDMLTALTGDFYRISIKPVQSNWDTHTQVTVSQLDNDKHENAGLLIVSRHPELVEAVALSVFKVYILFPGARCMRDENDDAAGQRWG